MIAFKTAQFMVTHSQLAARTCWEVGHFNGPDLSSTIDTSALSTDESPTITRYQPGTTVHRCDFRVVCGEGVLIQIDRHAPGLAGREFDLVVTFSSAAGSAV
jgi:hypothetical protein